MGVAVHCLNNYYTDNCSKFCLPSNDCDGHYSCDNATGDKLCMRGWEGVNCSQPKSDETRCADTTYCHNGGTCAQTLYNPNQAYCCCPPGFTGARCEMDIDECPMMPCVHGQCFNTMGSYTCTCDFGHPFTSITFNASNCFNDSDANANKSFNTNLANALSSSSLFKDHNLNTGNPNQFGISYSLFLIGYVYEHNTEAIKKNIKKTWEDTGNSNIDVLIIHKEFYIGKYGTLITEILYLVAHGTSLIPADQARPPSDSQMQKVFMTNKPVMNNVYTHDVHLPYRNGIRMSLKTTTRTSQYSIGTARRAVVTNWKNGSATKIQYMVDVLQTDSSLVDFTKPGDNQLAVSFHNSNLDICNCVARRVRTLWIEERKDANASMIEKAIRNAWMKTNKGVNVNISASVRRTENGFEGDEKGTKAKKILYYVSPKQGTTAVDEDDLDEPSNTMIKSELQNLVPGIKVYTHELKRQEAEESEWWIYLAIGLGVLAIIIIILISVLIAVRTYRHRQSETLKQDPKTVNGFSKEHFSKEPVMEKNSNGFYDYDDEDAKNHSNELCATTVLMNDTNSFLFGNEEIGKTVHTFTTNGALHFMKSNGQVYKGNTTIRGIDVDHWQSCLTWPIIGANFILDYYFTRQKWRTVSGYAQVPVRAVAYGQGQDPDNNIHMFNHTYEYYDFRLDITEDDEIFETPLGVVCPDRINTKKLPSIASAYHYRQEIVIPDMGTVQMADIYYDAEYKLVRYDYRNISPAPPTYSVNPISEIHDFNTGVRYFKDLATGNCSVYPIPVTSFDDYESKGAIYANGTTGSGYVLHMKNPLQFLFLNGNFTYTGNLDGKKDVMIYYNFLDYSAGHADISIYDVSTCYSSAANLQFQVRFPGPFSKSNEDYMKTTVKSLFANAMNVSYIRVQDIRIEFDNSNVYISATLLDRAPYAAQFNFIAASEIKQHDDVVYDQIKSPQDCAKFCVTNPGFVCNSFDFCGALTKGNCRLSNINGPTVQELSVDVAYANLKQKVYSKMLRFQIFDVSQGGTVSINTFLEFNVCWLDKVSLPGLTGQFSYNLEIVVPSIQQAYMSNIWYDNNYQLVRYDMVNPNPAPPLYDPNPVTAIHDYNTGLAYNIDRTLGNCTINAISDSSFDATSDPKYKNGTGVVMMKNPLELFTLTKHIDGQDRDSNRNVLGFGRHTMVNICVFMLQDSWAQLSSTGTNPVNNQPVKLDVSVEEMGFFLTYNYYNFNEEDPDLSNFDITPCFTGLQQRHFAIVFADQYHPVLDTRSKAFMQQARQFMAQATLSSSLRFQNFEVTFDTSHIFLIGTIVEQAPFIDDFTMVPGQAYPNQKRTVTFQKIQTAAACATMCRKLNNISCEGFDYCPSTQVCTLSSSHSDQSTSVPSKTCNHYSRTINSLNSIQPTIDGILVTMNDIVYKKLFAITINIGSNQKKTFTATKIRDGIVRDSNQRFSSSGVLSLFNMTQNSVIYLHNDAFKEGLSVDQCARACLVELQFDCQSFDYCYDKGDCLLSKTHPDDVPNSVQKHEFCDMYSRTYLARYNEEPGLTFYVPADLTLNNISSENLCAKMCNRNKAFKCKSFQFCASTTQCSLFKTHRLDLPQSAAAKNGVCSFYSRKYIDDFQLMGKKTIQFTQSMDFKNVTPSECAKLCVDMQAFNCKSFAYCGNSTLCRLTPAHPRLGTKITKSSTCDLYTSK
ncbi:hypothetical protein FSP39_011029 [Pinctada imbricata]|uniref:Delta-like protein n=1 Tax=Pinctada imbricata TaxID=66713 RepID=A0AA88XTY0_PINIB|nr:hypothetical protein FSP39_011029 [Pinctada imbricata]